MNVEDRLEILELDLIYLENEARALRERIRLATREPLSDEEIGKLCKDHFKVANLTSFVRAIEKAHGIGVDDE